MISDITNLKRKVRAEGVRDAKAEILNVGSLEIRIHTHQSALGCSGTGASRARRKYSARAFPTERAAAKFGAFDPNIATKCLATHPLASTPYRHAYCASAGRIGSQRH